jgi:hypothetical protein
MLDRQDIDALLIGALYGELTPADEARLSAHLDSHPTDRGALDDLKSARAAVRESRIFDLQLDPPQSVSALLLQEAHRRAPKRVAATTGDEKESWFYRFTRSFMAHPGYAAAAMLVLVFGVAGLLYVKKGDDGFAEKQVSAPSAVQTEAQDNLAQNAAPEAIAAGSAAPDPGARPLADQPADHDAADGKSGYTVQLDEKAAERGRRDSVDSFASKDRAEQQLAKPKQQAEATKKKAPAGMVVTTPQPQPKELDAPRAKTATIAKGSTGSKGDFAGADDAEGLSLGGAASAGPATGAVPGGGAGAAGPRTPSRAAPAQSQPSPPPPPPSPVATTTAKPSVSKEAEKPADAKAEAAPPKNSTLIAWAKAEHNRTIALANKGDCNAAAKLAVTVQNRAPDYYTQFMATDRALKKCQAYIAQERDAEAEKAAKTRAQKRVNADEPAPTTTTK